VLKEDGHVTIQHIAEVLGINSARVSRIVGRLGDKKVTACWVQRMLTDKQKQIRVSVCQAQPETFLQFSHTI